MPISVKSPAFFGTPESRAQKKREEDMRLMKEHEAHRDAENRKKHNEALRKAVSGPDSEVTPERFNEVVSRFEPDEAKPLGHAIVTKVFKVFADEKKTAQKTKDDAAQAVTEAAQAKEDRRTAAFESGRAPIPPPAPGPPSAASPEGRSFIKPAFQPEPRQDFEQRKLRSQELPRFAGSPKGRGVAEEIGARGGTREEQRRGRRAVDVAGATPTSTLKSFIPPKPTAAEKGITTTQQLSRDRDVLAAEEKAALNSSKERNSRRKKATELIGPFNESDFVDKVRYNKAVEDQITRLIKFEFAEKVKNTIEDAPTSRSEDAASDDVLSEINSEFQSATRLLRELKKQLDEIEGRVP